MPASIPASSTCTGTAVAACVELPLVALVQWQQGTLGLAACACVNIQVTVQLQRPRAVYTQKIFRRASWAGAGARGACWPHSGAAMPAAKAAGWMVLPAGGPQAHCQHRTGACLPRSCQHTCFIDQACVGGHSHLIGGCTEQVAHRLRAKLT